MEKRIIYKKPDGSVAVVEPTAQALELLTIAEIARRSVPSGRSYKIVDTTDLPDAPQEAWTVDDVDLTDGVGGRGQ